MTVSLEDYAGVVGRDTIEELLVLADRVRPLRIQHVNSTATGGGVAEILARLVPLLRLLGIETTWDVISGDPAFFAATKALHNALHGRTGLLDEPMLAHFREVTAQNASRFTVTGDVVWIHDPQPAGLIALKEQRPSKWVWRCHIDVSAPDPRAWTFLRPYVERFDAAVFSMPAFAQRLPIPQYLVAPSIDPTSDKNRTLDESTVAGVLDRFGIDRTRPILTQVSRFDRLKDPLGVIAAYRLVRKRHDCQLVLAGGGAADDPEGHLVLAEVIEAAGDDRDIHVLLLPDASDIVINALVRASSVVFQKSIREGFGLTVTEAMWKRKPVIGGAVGGIREQVIDGVTGFLVHSPEGAALRALQLLADPALGEAMGLNGHAHVKQNFLVTRQAKDYLLIALGLEHRDEHLVEL
jgi:trehalose synthase